MKLLSILAPLFLASCQTGPQSWSARSHEEMIGSCRAACGEGKFKSYDSYAAKCECFKGVENAE